MLKKTTIKWTGKATSGIWRREEIITSYNPFTELYTACLENGTISTVDSDPWEDALMEKNGKTEKDFYNEDGDFDFELYQNWIDEYDYIDLSDKDIYNIILEQDGNAYYQTFEYLDEKSDEYIEIDCNCFDKEGNFIK